MKSTAADHPRRRANERRKNTRPLTSVPGRERISRTKLHGSMLHRLDRDGSAAFFVGVVAADVFALNPAALLLRHTRSPTPMISASLLLGIVIFWGIARNELSRHAYHRRSALGQREPLLAAHHRYLCDAGAAVRRHGADLYAVRQGFEHLRRRTSPTFDLRLPVWPFFAVAWIGDVAAVLLIAVRTYRLIFHPEMMKDTRSCKVGASGTRCDEHQRCRYHGLRRHCSR